jgi:outer membrane lipoprotein carrier protein
LSAVERGKALSGPRGARFSRGSLRRRPGRLQLRTAASVALSVVFVSPGGLRGQTSEALTLMEEAEARYREIPLFCATFDQSLEVPLMGETHVSKGEICQAQPDLFSMRWSDPAGDAVVADGESFWVYYPSADPRQVLQFSMEVRPGGLDFHREFLEEPGRKYRLSYVGEESVTGRPAHVISARPREPAAFTEARLWLDRDRLLILQIRIGMENGSVRTLTLSDIDLDPPPDPGRFRFTPPPGAQVIRRDD